MPEFKNTDRVHHERYGYGDVLDVRGVEVTVLFDVDTDGVAERRMLSSMGGLRLVPADEEEDAADNRAADQMEQAVRSGQVRTVPAEETPPPKPPVEEALTYELAKGDEVAMSFEASFKPIGRVAILRSNGGYRVNLYSGGTMCFGPQELKLVRRDAEVTREIATKAMTPTPPAEPDPLLMRMETEIARRGRGAMLAVTQAAGVTISLIYHWRREKRITSGDDARAKIQAWIDSPWEPKSDEPDQLLLDVEATIVARGRGATMALAKFLGVHKTSLDNWRSGKNIPLQHRDRVQAWIKETPVAKTHKLTVDPAGFKGREAVVVDPEGFPAKETPVAKQPDPPPTAPGITQETIKRLLTEMGARLTIGWVIEGGDLVKKEAWIMGNAP